MNQHSNYLFTKENEWISIEDDFAYIGITELAIKELGIINNIEIHTLGKVLTKNQVFGRLKTSVYLCKLVMPFKAEIVKLNPLYFTDKGFASDKCCSDHWIVKVKLMHPVDTSSLLSMADYKDFKRNDLLNMIKYLR